MNFVDNVYFILPRRRCNRNFLTQLSNIIDATITSPINFNDVDIIVFNLVFKAVHFVRQNPCYRSLAAPTRANQQIGMAHLTLLQSLNQWFRYLRLPYHFRQFRRPISPIQTLHYNAASTAAQVASSLLAGIITDTCEPFFNLK